MTEKEKKETINLTELSRNKILIKDSLVAMWTSSLLFVKTEDDLIFGLDTFCREARKLQTWPRREKRNTSNYPQQKTFEVNNSLQGIKDFSQANLFPYYKLFKNIEKSPIKSILKIVKFSFFYLNWSRSNCTRLVKVQTENVSEASGINIHVCSCIAKGL